MCGLPSRRSGLFAGIGLACALVLLVQPCARAGGPMVVGGPGFGVEGRPFTWDLSSGPIPYRSDGGPLSATINNTAAITRVQGMFQVWQDVPTAAITYTRTGSILSVGSFTDGDVSTAAEFNEVVGSCVAGTQSPIIFDADGMIFDQLVGDPNVIGFAGPCKLDPDTGRILSGGGALNGRFQDGINNPTASPPNFELTSNEFDEAITHELGHFSGLDHSQINVQVLNQPPGNCNLDDLAGLPLMFPVFYCQSKKSAGLPTLAPDDAAWISKLYPNGSYAPSYGIISGVIYFSDGITHVQGLNVIARRLDDPSTPQDESKRIAVSVVSGFLFTGNPGQPITGTNSGGDPFGSRNPTRIGYYEIPAPPGTYNVQVENINSSFSGGSSVGPLDPPANTYGAIEFWHQYESAFDNPAQKDPVPVQAGQMTAGIDIILNGTAPRFDQYEDGQVKLQWEYLKLPLAGKPDPKDAGRAL